MTQQEYKDKTKEITTAIADLKKQQNELDETYFNHLLETDPYKGYNKVVVAFKKWNKTNTEELFITGRRLDRSGGTLGYEFNKVKKDGTRSLNRRTLWYSEEIESITPI